MVPQQDRTEKLVSLTYALLTTRVGYTRTQLRTMVDDYQNLSEDAFERKFERDKETLRNLGVTLVDGKGRRDHGSLDSENERRYRILAEDYQLPSLELSAQEAAILGLASSVVAGGGLGVQAARAAERLGVDARSDQALFSPRIDGGEEHLEALIRYVSASQPVRFGYRTANGRESTRTVMPWGLGHRHGHWYLAAGDTARDGERLFRLDRITGSIAQAAPKASDHIPDAYGRPDRFSMAAALDRLERSSPTRTARLLALGVSGGTLAARAVSRTDGADGVELAVEYADEADLAREIAAEGVRVLAPASLAAAVLSVLDDAVAGVSAPAPRYKLSRHAGGRASAEQTVSRALDLVAFVVQRGGASIDEVMERFGLDRDELEAELTRLRFCGVPNGQHDELLDVEWDQEAVSITNAQVLSQPMNLSLVEATTVLMGLDALASAPAGALSADSARAVEQLSARLRGLRPELADFDRIIAVRAAARESGPLVGELAQAIDERHPVRLDYAGRHARSQRVVEPVRLMDVGGRSYLQAWCRLRQGPRTFRLDRMVSAQTQPEVFAVDDARVRAVRGAPFEPDAAAPEAEVLWSGAWEDAAHAHHPERTGKSPEGMVSTIRVRDHDHLVRLAARSAGAVRVLGPESVRDGVLAALEQRRQAAALDVEAIETAEIETAAQTAAAKTETTTDAGKN